MGNWLSNAVISFREEDVLGVDWNRMISQFFNWFVNKPLDLQLELINTILVIATKDECPEVWQNVARLLEIVFDVAVDPAQLSLYKTFFEACGVGVHNRKTNASRCVQIIRKFINSNGQLFINILETLLNVTRDGDVPKTELHIIPAMIYFMIGQYDKSLIHVKEMQRIIHSQDKNDLEISKTWENAEKLCCYMSVLSLRKMERNDFILSDKEHALTAVQFCIESIETVDELVFCDPNMREYSFVIPFSIKAQFTWHSTLASAFLFLQKPETALLALDLGKAKSLQCLIQLRVFDDLNRNETWAKIKGGEEKERLCEITRDLQLHQQNHSTVLVYGFNSKGFLHAWILNDEDEVKHFILFETATRERLISRTNSLLSRGGITVRSNYSFYDLPTRKESNAKKEEKHDFLNSAPGVKTDHMSASIKDVSLSFSKTANDHEEVGGKTSFAATNGIKSATNKLKALNERGSAKDLYKFLIHPFEQSIKGNKLIIVPDQFLFFVPFCLLMDENGDYLSTNYSIQVIPSVHTLLSSKAVPFPVTLGPALFVGNPTVGDVCRDGKKIDPPLESLPSATVEAESLASLFNAKALIEKEATKAKVVEGMLGASIIHIAAHGDASFGEIFLAPSTRKEDSLPREGSYMLQELDVLNLKLSARLVVLCCCNTGRGEVSSEGVFGLARSFLRVGTRSVLIALWPIPDGTTVIFMENFYRLVCEEKSVCEALKLTMNFFQNHKIPVFQSFTTWAPFEILGEDVRFTKKDIEEIRIVSNVEKFHML